MKRNIHQCVFLAGFCSFPRGKILLLSPCPNSQVHKTCFPTLPEEFKDTHRTHSTIPHGKRSQESVFFVCLFFFFFLVLSAIPLVTLIRWNSTISNFTQGVLSSQFISENSNTWPNLLVSWRVKWTTMSFCKALGCNYPGFRVEKYCISHMAPIPRVTKTCFPEVLEMERHNTPQIHWITPWEERTGESSVRFDSHICYHD